MSDTWIVYFDGGFEEFATEAEALKAAEDIIDDCRGEDHWPEELDNLIVAHVTHRAVQCNVVRADQLDEDGCYEGRYYPSGCDFYCDYKMESRDEAAKAAGGE